MVKQLAKQRSITQAEAKQQINDVLSLIVDGLTIDQSVKLKGFGTFKISSRKSKKLRDPKTQEWRQIPAYKIPVFIAGKPFKESIKQEE